MKKFTSTVFFAFLLSLSYVIAQMPAAIDISPANATAYDEITLTFDPSQACFQTGTLVGSASVSMHSGVIPIGGNPGNWEYVVAWDGTGGTGASPDLVDNGNGTFSFTYIPKDFYGFPTGSIITHIVAVFNNGSNWNTDGRDFDGGGTNCIDFVIPLSYTTTDPSMLFKVNMNKQIADGNFNATGGNVYAMIQGMDSLLLENSLDGNNNPTNIYTGEITTGLINAQVLDFHFRMNNTDETVSRSKTLTLGQNTVDVWFDDMTLSPLTLNCDMSYYIAEGWFDPLNDYVDVAGDFNLWEGASHHLDDTDGDYNYTILLNSMDLGKIEFKFRINGSWDDLTSEFPNSGPNRILMLAVGGFDHQAIYNNYMPGGIPVTFICHTDYQISAGNFDPLVDFLGLSGTFNNWTGNVQLADRDGMMAYSLNIPIDISTSANIEFNFSINNNAATTESFTRYYTVLDTAGGGVDNTIEVWYNNDDPAIGSAPRANNAAILGLLETGETLTASYDYEDVNSDPEGATTFKWAVADDTLGSNMTIMSDGTASTYLIDQADLNKYVFLEIRPVATTETGTNSAGTMYGDTVKLMGGPVSPVSIETTNVEELRMFPNPATGIISIENLINIEDIQILSLDGKLINTLWVEGKRFVSIDIKSLPSGVYFLTFRNTNEMRFTKKLIKL